MTYAKSGLFWSQCFLPSLVIRKAQAGAGKSSLGLLCSFRLCWWMSVTELMSVDSTELYYITGGSALIIFQAHKWVSVRSYRTNVRDVMIL